MSRIRAAHLAFLLLPLQGIAQDFDRTNKRYADKFQFAMEEGETIERTWFHYVVTRAPDDHWIVRTFYPETGQITAHMTYSDKALSTLDGQYIRWYDNGELRERGQHEEGSRSGPWTLGTFGGGKSEGRYENGQETGIWTTTHRNGSVTRSMPYLRGKLHGIGYAYDTTGVLLDTLVYESDSLLNGEPLRTLVARKPALADCDYIKSDELRDACTQRGILEHLRKNLRYPEEAMEVGVTGLAHFQLVVDKDGQVVGIVALNALCRAIEDECRRVFATMPPWKPGTIDERPVKVQYQQPVRFTLR
jgi:Gram-negative bacterial TonB protein C-terminal